MPKSQPIRPRRNSKQSRLPELARRQYHLLLSHMAQMPRWQEWLYTDQCTVPARYLETVILFLEQGTFQAIADAYYINPTLAMWRYFSAYCRMCDEHVSYRIWLYQQQCAAGYTPPPGSPLLQPIERLNPSDNLYRIFSRKSWPHLHAALTSMPAAELVRLPRLTRKLLIELEDLLLEATHA